MSNIRTLSDNATDDNFAGWSNDMQLLVEDLITAHTSSRPVMKEHDLLAEYRDILAALSIAAAHLNDVAKVMDEKAEDRCNMR